MVLVMTVEPGFGGQALIPACLDKVTAIRKEAERLALDVRLEVDGGITPETATLARAAGAEILVAGSSVFRAEDMRGAMDALRG